MNKTMGRLIGKIHRKKAVYINAALKSYNITSSEQSVLMHLYGHPNATQESICAKLHIDRAAMSRIIQSLERKGYAVKNRDQADRRYNRVSVTQKALDCKEVVFEKIGDWNRLIDGALDNETRELVTNALGRIVQAIEGAKPCEKNKK
jgi:DNA-binding MarR family transcriptional regulator